MVTLSDGWLVPSLAVSVTLDPSLAVTVTVAVSPAVAPLPAFSSTRPYWVSVTTLTESMIGGLTGLLVSPEPLSSTGNAGDRLADVVARDQLADDRILVVARAVRDRR